MEDVRAKLPKLLVAMQVIITMFFLLASELWPAGVVLAFIYTLTDFGVLACRDAARFMDSPGKKAALYAIQLALALLIVLVWALRTRVE